MGKLNEFHVCFGGFISDSRDYMDKRVQQNCFC